MRTLVLAASLVVALPAAAVEPDCQPIVAATVAEMKAGATDWNAQTETLVRRAAGSACVKAFSGAYGDRSSAARAPGDGPAPVARTTADAKGAPTAKEQVAEGEAGDTGSGDAGKTFLGFKRNDVSASPSKKPYQRKRQPAETEAADESE